MNKCDGAIPAISVVMSVYNGEKFLQEAIDSVLAQTYQNWELIFWDNQSTDNSAKIFKSIDDQRLKYYYAPQHTWLYEARNYAIEKSSGEYFAFLDVDDWWIPEKLEKQLRYFENEVGIFIKNFVILINHLLWLIFFMKILRYLVDHQRGLLSLMME